MFSYFEIIYTENSENIEKYLINLRKITCNNTSQVKRKNS